MSKLEKVIEQTTFLMEKQKQTHKECQAMFDDLLSFIDKKVEDLRDEEEIETLENIHDAIAGQVEQLSQDAKDDISFLMEHLKALNALKSMDDKKKAAELLNELIDEQEELLETSDFKDEVARESENAKQQLIAMVDDLKNALNEGNIQEVEVYLESLFGGEEDDSSVEYRDGNESEYEEDEEGEEYSSCSGCDMNEGCGSESDGCCPSESEEGDDIFSYFDKDDKQNH